MHLPPGNDDRKSRVSDLAASRLRVLAPNELAKFTILFIAGDVNCDVQLQCGIDEYCLNNDPVQYQCIVTGSTILQWRIRDVNMTSLATEAYTTGSDLVTTPAPFPNIPFFTDFISKSPTLISNISFTVQSSINGYTIHCEDGDGNMENCTVNIAGEL